MISVIVPVLNEESAIENFLEHLDRQEASFSDFEVIVVDGGSSDRTLEILASSSFSRVSVIQTAPGRAQQMNVGADSARGEIVLFLHADTFLPEHGLQKIDTAINARGFDAGYFNVRLDNDAFACRIVGSMINVRDRIFGGFTGDQAIFVRKELFDSIGHFKQMELCEDLDLARKLHKAGNVTRIKDPVITSARRWEKRGLIRTILLMWKIRLLFYAGVEPAKLAKIYTDVR